MKRLFGSLIAPIALICWVGKAILEEPLETVILIGIYMIIHIIFPGFIINYALRTTNLEDKLVLIMQSLSIMPNSSGYPIIEIPFKRIKYLKTLARQIGLGFCAGSPNLSSFT